MSRQMSSVNEYYETLSERFVAEAAKGVDAIFQWTITGDGGRTFHARVLDGALDVQDGLHDAPNVTLSAEAANYLKIINGEMNGMKAVMTKKMAVNGNIKLARQMQKIFPIEF